MGQSFYLRSSALRLRQVGLSIGLLTSDAVLSIEISKSRAESARVANSLTTLKYQNTFISDTVSLPARILNKLCVSYALCQSLCICKLIFKR